MLLVQGRTLLLLLLFDVSFQYNKNVPREVNLATSVMDLLSEAGMCAHMRKRLVMREAAGSARPLLTITKDLYYPGCDHSYHHTSYIYTLEALASTFEKLSSLLSS